MCPIQPISNREETVSSDKNKAVPPLPLPPSRSFLMRALQSQNLLKVAGVDAVGIYSVRTIPQWTLADAIENLVFASTDTSSFMVPDDALLLITGGLGADTLPGSVITTRTPRLT